jgi:predicted butyrate kinase (DUF1464 family)
MKKQFKVEVKGKRAVYYFETKEEAEAYAITATVWSGGKYRITVWSGGKYRITEVIVAEEVAK